MNGLTLHLGLNYIPKITIHSYLESNKYETKTTLHCHLEKHTTWRKWKLPAYYYEALFALLRTNTLDREEKMSLIESQMVPKYVIQHSIWKSSETKVSSNCPLVEFDKNLYRPFARKNFVFTLQVQTCQKILKTWFKSSRVCIGNHFSCHYHFKSIQFHEFFKALCTVC